MLFVSLESQENVQTEPRVFDDTWYMCTTVSHRRWISSLALAWPLLGFLLLGTGCATSRGGKPSCPTSPSGTPDYTAGLPDAQRGQVTVDLAAIASFESLAIAPADDVRGGEPYRSLGPADCQCIAVEASAGGNRIAAERDAVCAQHSADPKRMACLTQLRMQLLSTAEIAARDLTSAQALEYYYKLAAAEHGRDIFAKSLRELSDAQMKLSQLQSRGLQNIVYDGSLQRQRYELSSRLGQLELDRHELNENLRNKLGVSINEPWWSIWPDTPLAVDAKPIDVETAVAIGLNTRAELRLLRLVLLNLNAETLSATRTVLAQVNGMLGLQPPSLCRRCCLRLLNGPLSSDCSEEAEVAARRAQIAQQLAEQEAAVASEVRMAARTIETRLEQVVLARQELASWSSRLAAVEAKLSTVESTFLDISLTRVQKLEAEHNLVRQVVGWHLAHVQLKKAQGILSRECGYGPKSPHRATVKLARHDTRQLPTGHLDGE